MEGLFNLISESPLLLFFIIAAIISFVRGRGGQQQEKQSGQPSSQSDSSQQKQQTRQRETSDQDVDWKDIFRQETRPTQPQPSASRQSRSESVSSLPEKDEKELSRSTSELQERYEWLEKQQKRAREKGNSLENSPITRNDLTRERVHLDFSHVTKNDAIKGVIWSEILGKPKARRK